jgi:hypothetical protein
MKSEKKNSLEIIKKAAEELNACEIKEGDALIFLAKKDGELSYAVNGLLDDIVEILYIASFSSPIFLKAMKMTVLMLEKSKKNM